VRQTQPVGTAGINGHRLSLAGERLDVGEREGSCAMTVDIFWKDTMYVISWNVILVLGCVVLCLLAAIVLVVWWLLRRSDA
jgi:hypothetical protein